MIRTDRIESYLRHSLKEVCKNAIMGSVLEEITESIGKALDRVIGKTKVKIFGNAKGGMIIVFEIPNVKIGR